MTLNTAFPPLPPSTLPFWSWLQQYQHAAQDAEPYGFISMHSALHLAFSISPVNVCLSLLGPQRQVSVLVTPLGEQREDALQSCFKTSQWWKLCCISVWDTLLKTHIHFRRNKIFSFPTVLTKITEWHKWSVLPRKSHGDRGGRQKVSISAFWQEYPWWYWW